MLELMLDAALIGAGATAIVDAWAVARKAAFGIPAPDYALVGRWFGHMAHGRFRHARMADSPRIAGERWIGWIAHYAIGIAFAAILLAIWGGEWVRDPSVTPALIVGIGSVAAPFLLMQPGMGAGVAASRAPRPAMARMQSILTHAVFGLGLYATALVLSLR